MTQTIKDRLKSYINSKGLTIREFERKINVSNGYVGSIKNYPSPEIMSAIALTFPDINPVWLLMGEGEMLKATPDDAPAPVEPETRPHIPIEVAAGLTTGFAESAALADCARRPVNPSFPRYDYTITVNGRSMEPELFPGDTLAIRAADPDSLSWGHTYVISTTEGVLVKRIYDGGPTLRLVSNNPDFAPVSIPKTDVLALYRVVGMQRII